VGLVLVVHWEVSSVAAVRVAEKLPLERCSDLQIHGSSETDFDRAAFLTTFQ